MLAHGEPGVRERTVVMRARIGLDSCYSETPIHSAAKHRPTPFCRLEIEENGLALALQANIEAVALAAVRILLMVRDQGLAPRL